jgi:hypothetical protein
MAYNYPQVSDFKNQFIRDFPYGTDPNVAILDQDIQNAFAAANVNFSPNFWDSQQTFTLGYLYLSAHFLCMNIRASSQGINGQYNFGQVSKGAGSVNEAFSIPQRILDNPEFAMYAKTTYGAQYLMWLLPQLAGQMFSVCGRTKP